MKLTQAIKTLKEKGFRVETNEQYPNSIWVTLNRKLSSMEVWEALDFEIPNNQIVNVNGRVLILGLE